MRVRATDPDPGRRPRPTTLLPTLMGLVAFLVALACTSGPAHASLEAPERAFAPTSFWNKPLRREAPLAPNSRALVRKLVHQKNRYGPWINTTQYSAPVYVVGRRQRRVPVHVDTPSSMYSNAADAAELQRDLAAVPIPADAEPAAGTDSQIIIWQPSTDTMWELWIAHKVGEDGCLWGNEEIGGWHAAWGARIDHVSTQGGRVEAPFGAAASGLPLLGGLIRHDELAAGRIDHALAVSIPEVTSRRYVWPATRTDGNSTAPDAIPEGTRFRLDPHLRLARLDLAPVVLAMARAAKRHGIVVADRSDGVVFDAEDPSPLRADPYLSLFDQQWPSQLLEAFPWGHLQALAPRRAGGYQR